MTYTLSYETKKIMKNSENLTFYPSKLPSKFDAFLNSLKSIKNERIIISSFLRYKEDQARIMSNLLLKAIRGYKNKEYTKIAEKIIMKYYNSYDPNTIRLSDNKKMQEECYKEFLKIISKNPKDFAHVAGNAIDIAPSSLSKEEVKLALHKELQELKDKNKIGYLSPYTKPYDEAFHIVIS